jgi:hypothetical protein
VPTSFEIRISIPSTLSGPTDSRPPIRGNAGAARGGSNPTVPTSFEIRISIPSTLSGPTDSRPPIRGNAGAARGGSNPTVPTSFEIRMSLPSTLSAHAAQSKDLPRTPTFKSLVSIGPVPQHSAGLFKPIDKGDEIRSTVRISSPASLPGFLSERARLSTRRRTTDT